MKTISPSEAKALILTPPENFTILDVRTPSEHQEGHIAHSINIDFYSPSFESKIKDLSPQNTYLVYCKSGGRSEKTCTLLKELGFKNIYNLAGGFTNWQLQSHA